MKRVSSWTLGLGLVAASLLAQPVRADGYASLKEGRFLSTGFVDSFEYDKNRGELREVEFNWGSKALAKRFTGNIRLDPDNRIAGLALGMSIRNNDLFMVRQFTIKDRMMFRGDPFFGPTNVSLGNVDAKMTEVSYVSSLSETAWLVSYGKSNFPVQLEIRDGMDVKGYVLDLAPRTEYLVTGFRMSNLNRMLAEDGPGEQSGWKWYGEGAMKFGLMRQQLSQQIADSIYGNNASVVNGYGIRGQSGVDAVMRGDLEAGIAYLINTGFARGVVSIGGFWGYDIPWISGLLNFNKTSTGYSWGLGSNMVYCVVGRVAIKF